MTMHDHIVLPEFGPEYPADLSPRLARGLMIAETSAQIVATSQAQIQLSLRVLNRQASE